MPRSSSSGNDLEQRERGVEVDVDGVVERVVHALEQREPADVVGIRLRAAHLAVLPERAAVDEEVQLVEQRHRVPVGARGSSRYGRLPGLDRPSPGRGVGEGVPREVDRARAGPAPRLRVALPPATAGAELDDRQVPGDREPHGPALVRAEHERRRDRRARRPIRWPTALRWPAPGLQPPVGGEVGPKLPVGDRIERRARAQLHAVATQRRDRQRAAQGGRRVVGGVAELHGERPPLRHHAVGSRRGRTRGARTDRPR